MIIKISIPAEILAKPGRISEKEFALIMDHPQVGYDIIKKNRISMAGSKDRFTTS
jgi:HD-GYP domain-containing protein (c-di-GMP phosphodiesterase class II)